MSDSVELPALPKRERLYPERGNAAIYGYTTEQMHAFYAKGWNDALRAQVPDGCLESLVTKLQKEADEASVWVNDLPVVPLTTATQAVRDAYRTAASPAAHPRVQVPDGFVLVPERMHLSPDDIANIAFMCGGDESATDNDERWAGGVLWVGETEGDNGEKYYGLNIACVECLEEGSIPICEFTAAPAAPQSGCDGTCYRSPQGLCATHDAEAHGEAAKPSSETREVADVAGTDEHLGFIEYCGDMLRKLGKPMLGSSLRHTAETLRLRLTEQPQPDSRGEG